jgi:Zn-finger nucleic acid-binding protein
MQCPTDGATLTMSERSGIEIDYCPTCRGVWLDRGELDKIIERSLTMTAPAPPPAPEPTRSPRGPEPTYDRYPERRRDDDRPEYRGDSRGDHRGDYRPDYRRKKKESWLSEIFD